MLGYSFPGEHRWSDSVLIAGGWKSQRRQIPCDTVVYTFRTTGRIVATRREQAVYCAAARTYNYRYLPLTLAAAVCGASGGFIAVGKLAN